MTWIIWILLGIAAIFAIITTVKCLLGSHHLKVASQYCCNVFGPKGSGKSLLFSKMMTYYPKGYLATAEFYHKGEIVVNVKDINVNPNRSEDALNGDFKKVEGGWHPDWEGSPVFIDDAGIYLPNYLDTQLKKIYPSLPLAYALWRHCYDAPIHINSQDPQRVWKLLREQQEMWILARGVRKIGPFLFVEATIYDKEDSAIKRLDPMRSTIFNKFNAAELNQYEAEHGYIKNIKVCCITWHHRYNSRYFLPRLYDLPEEEKGEENEKKKIKILGNRKSKVQEEKI